VVQYPADEIVYRVNPVMGPHDSGLVGLFPRDPHSTETRNNDIAIDEEVFMCDEEHAPRVRLEIIDEVKLPATSVIELTSKLDRWKLKGMPPTDLRAAITEGELGDDVLIIVEVVTDGAVPEDLHAAFRLAELIPGNLIDAIRLLVQSDSSEVPPFPFLCLGDIITTTVASAPLVERARGKTLIAMDIDLRDDELDIEPGWTDHCFVPAHRFAPSPTTIPMCRQES
jgi:hypothetical protein